MASGGYLPQRLLTLICCALHCHPTHHCVSPGPCTRTPPPSGCALANTTNAVRVSVSDGVSRVQANFRILVGPVGSGTGSEAKAAVPTRIAMALSADGEPLLRVSGPEGAVFQVEASDLSGSPWEPVGSVPAVQTLGEDFPPVEVPIPVDESRPFRRFRLRKL